MKYNFTIDPDDKFYPDANEWMWTYCTFLGKFTDSKGNNYDLGVHIEIDKEAGYYEVVDATVHSNEPGDYTSGDFAPFVMESTTREWKLEVYRRAKLMNILK